MRKSPLFSLVALTGCLAGGPFIGANGAPDDATGNPPELGVVDWGHDLEAAKTRSAETGRPVLLLFQEIPGCATCRSFGAGPLSHPLLVEAIEDEFVPVAVYNNRPGIDATILKAFGEPAWNNPVVRFVDASGKDVLPRRDGVWSTYAVARRMADALRAAKRTVPAYLDLVAQETAGDDDPARRDRTTFAMYCYWEGEARLGDLDGVTRTRAGWVDGREVVEVEFDPTTIGYDKLLASAQRMQCAMVAYAHTDEQWKIAKTKAPEVTKRLDARARDASDSDQRFSLGRSEARFLPLTPLQATKVNSAMRLGGDARKWISPRQQDLLVGIRSALQRDPNGLDGLRRPEAVKELGAYERKLRKSIELAASGGS